MSYIEGNIPEKIVYVYSSLEEVTIGCDWEYQQQKIDVYPSFIVDASKANTMKTAEIWATRRINYRNVKKAIGLTKDDKNNKPIKNLRLIRLDIRSEGGRAYKVVIDGKYYVDLREDVLMDVLLRDKVDNGILSGEYIWARHGTQMKLVRVGSDLHSALITSTNRDKLGKIPNAKFEVGGVYATKRGDTAVFLGYVSTTQVFFDSKTQSAEKKKLRKGMLFYEFRYGEDIPKEFTTTGMRWKNTIDRSPLDFTIRVNHVFREKITNIPIKFDVIKWVREGSRRIIKESICDLNKKGSRSTISDIYCHFEITSDLSNMYEFGSKPIEVFDIKKFLIFL